MRKANAIISISIIVLLAIHAIAGAYQMMGVVQGNNPVMKVLALIMICLVGVHIVIGIKLTFDTLSSLKKSGKSYFKDNIAFWIRRISGFSIIIFVIFHVLIFYRPQTDVFRLSMFGNLQLIASIMLVISLVIHIICNIKPLMIALGSYKLSRFAVDIMLIISVILFFCAVAFVIYYFRWNIW